MTDVTLATVPLREDLRSLQPYGAPQLVVPYQLNTNENPHPPSPGLVEDIVAAVQDAAAGLNRYPDRDAVELRMNLAHYISSLGYRVGQNNIWAANGSNEILQHILLAFAGPGRKALGSEVSYSMHALIAQGCSTEFITVPARDDYSLNTEAFLAAIEEHQPHVVFVCRPNNPTGGSAPLKDVVAILDAAPGIVVVDEAYAEFSTSPSVLELLEHYEGSLIVSRTMSKAFAFAGGRLGYMIAHPALVEAMLLVRLPYHLSSLTQAVACAALEHAPETLASVAKVVSERERVCAALQEMGYTVHPSDANFVLFGNFSDNKRAWQEYLERGVLVRDNNIAHNLRVTIGLPHENDAFLRASNELKNGDL